jgi:hypothetical protein
LVQIGNEVPKGTKTHPLFEQEKFVMSSWVWDSMDSSDAVKKDKGRRLTPLFLMSD